MSGSGKGVSGVVGISRNGSGAGTFPDKMGGMAFIFETVSRRFRKRGVTVMELFNNFIIGRRTFGEGDPRTVRYGFVKEIQ